MAYGESDGHVTYDFMWWLDPETERSKSWGEYA